MASKRQLKKRVSRLCFVLASDMLLAAHLSDQVKPESVKKIINDIFSLQNDVIGKTTFAYDHTKRDFASKHDYKMAREQYNRVAYRQLLNEYAAGITAIVKEMNEAIPADVRQQVSKI